MNKINAYEYSGIICPGALSLWIFDRIFHYGLSDTTSTVGGFGFFLILAFCFGNLVQGVTNLLEDIFWNPGKYTEKQLKNEGIEEAPKKIYLLIRKNGGSTDRVDIFNKQYGLMRGMFVCFLLSAMGSGRLNELLTLLFCCFISGYRAFHFTKLYSNELISEYKIALEK